MVANLTGFDSSLRWSLLDESDPAGMCGQGIQPGPNVLMCLRDLKTEDTQMKISIRTNPANPNHHLWNNHGTWFIHYVVHPTAITKERVRRSLGTKSLSEARRLRDRVLGRAPNSEALAA